MDVLRAGVDTAEKAALAGAAVRVAELCYADTRVSVRARGNAHWYTPEHVAFVTRTLDPVVWRTAVRAALGNERADVVVASTRRAYLHVTVPLGEGEADDVLLIKGVTSQIAHVAKEYTKACAKQPSTRLDLTFTTGTGCLSAMPKLRAAFGPMAYSIVVEEFEGSGEYDGFAAGWLEFTVHAADPLATWPKMVLIE